MRPRASVVIPVYNRAHSVLPTLQSVRGQTMRDFECIVVDDGSFDRVDLQRIVVGLDDPRFRYVLQANGGASSARNRGAKEAKGAFVAFLDSDDRWLPDKLQRDCEAGADRRVVFSPMKVERGGRIVGRRPKNAPRPGESIAEYLACRQGFVPASTVAVPTKIARKVRFNEALVFGDDADFAIRLAAEGADFHMIEQALSVMNDNETGDRISRPAGWQPTLAWLDEIRPLISDRAYHAFCGSHVARLATEAAHYRTALRFYFGALIRGAMPPVLAAKALVQVLVPRSVYARFRAGRRR